MNKKYVNATLDNGLKVSVPLSVLQDKLPTVAPTRTLSSPVGVPLRYEHSAELNALVYKMRDAWSTYQMQLAACIAGQATLQSTEAYHSAYRRHEKKYHSLLNKLCGIRAAFTIRDKPLRKDIQNADTDSGARIT